MSCNLPYWERDLVAEAEPQFSPDLVIVTGAGRGIGRSIALSIAETGAHVLCISQSDNVLQTASAIRERGGTADGIAVDLSDFISAETHVTEWLSKSSFRRIGVVLAAAVLGPTGPLYNTPLSEWDKAFKVNILGNLAVSRAALPYQLENRCGRILFFAGGGAAYAYPIFPAYAATKTALVRTVENLHEDLKEKGDFAVAILAPGAVETDTLATVRASGGYVRTTVAIEEPTRFAKEFLTSAQCGFSGCFVHVRDVWPQYLNNGVQVSGKDLWKLRRIE
jgi:NAD(P)-dependent dehydrogenase (short-subunit alcohol dehydrogenase family)